MSPARASGPAGLTIEPLAKVHDRAGFSCGDNALDRYLKERASQDARKHVAAPFVLVGEDRRVLGFYTLSSSAIVLAELPVALSRKLPKYPAVPATLLGRLAVDQQHRGQRLGEYLLLDALARSLELSSEIASYAVVVDAKGEGAARFYRSYDFEVLPDQPLRLFIPMTKVRALFSE